MYFKSLFNRKFILMLILALFMPWQTKAQETLTVCEGTKTSSNAPIKSGSGSQSEFIYPASMLGNMEGGLISSVKFFASQTNANYTNTVTVFVQEVSETTETTSTWHYVQNTATKVYEGTTLSVANGEMVIEFTSPYEYAGGNTMRKPNSKAGTSSATRLALRPHSTNLIIG
jgi:hypothetical protein